MSLHFVDTQEKRDQFWDWLTGTEHQIVAIDIEGNNLEAPHLNRVRMVQFGDSNDGWSIPTADLGDTRVVLDNSNLVRETLQYLVGICKVLHNMSYDIPQLMYHLDIPEWDWANTDDTMLAAQIHMPHHSASLKFLNDKYIMEGSSRGSKRLEDFFNKGYPCTTCNGEKPKPKCKDCGNRGKIPYTWATVPVRAKEYWAYGALDTILTARLWHYMNDRGMFSGRPYEDKLALTEVCTVITIPGLQVDVDYCKCEVVNTELKIDELTEKAQSEYGIENLNAPIQIAKVFTVLGEELKNLTKTGKPRVNKETLETFLLSDDQKVSSLAELVLEYRNTKKSHDYFTAFLKYADGDGKLHAQINSNFARTGRMSSRSPNLQNLTSKFPYVRNAIIPG